MPTEKHTYMRSHKLAGSVLQANLAAEDETLREKAAAAPSGRAAKTLIKEGRIRVTLVALRKGTTLRAHGVAGDVTIHVRRGAVEIGTQETRFRAAKDDLVAFRARLQHDVRALSDSSILITASMR